MKRALREAGEQGQGRPWRHARSARQRRAADRDRRGDQAVWADARRVQGLRVHRPLRRGNRHARQRRAGGRHQRPPTPPRPGVASSTPSPAKSSRSRPPIPRSRSKEGGLRPRQGRRGSRAQVAQGDRASVLVIPAKAGSEGLGSRRGMTKECDEVTLVATVPRAPTSAALARDIAHALDTVGHVTYLAADQAGPFARQGDFAGHSRKPLGRAR